MKKILLLSLTLCLVASLQASKPMPEQPSAIDFAGFMELSEEVSKHRAKRLVNLDDFLKMSLDESTIILDTRSERMFNNRHISGAVHLNFSDFTQEKLSKLIPDQQTRILIYCNNNFTDDPAYMALKKLQLALNIPSYINLYGYGYKNVYELNESVSVKDERLKFSGSYNKVNIIKPANLENLIFVPEQALATL